LILLILGDKPAPEFRSIIWHASFILGVFIIIFAIYVKNVVRHYFDTQQQYRDSLKKAQSRQYLQDESDIAFRFIGDKCVPTLSGLLLLLFLVGFGDLCLETSTKTGIFSIVIIGFGSVLYVSVPDPSARHPTILHMA